MMNILKNAIYVALVSTTLIGASAYACVIPKSDFKHLKCTTTADRFIAVKDNGSPVALVDKNGKKVADLFAYDAILPSQFHAGLVPVKKGGKVGYINRNGKLVIDTIYDDLGGRQWANGVNDNKILVKKNGQSLTLDLSGNPISTKPTQTATQTAAQLPKTTPPPKPKAQTTSILPPKAKSPQSPKVGKQEPIQASAWADDNFFAHKQGNKWGYVNRAGTPMIVYAFDEAAPFSEGLAGVRIDEKWGFITPAGDLVIDFRFDNKGIDILSRDVPELVAPFVFKNGRAWIGNLKTGQKLCIDRQGNSIECMPTPTQTIPPQSNQPAPQNNTLINTLENLPLLLPTSNTK